MNTKDVLIQVWELLSDESRWTKTKMARDAAMLVVPYDDPSAVCWCLVGALRKTSTNGTNFFGAWQKLEDMCGHIADFNDSHTHAEVIALLDRAIAEAA